MKKEIHRIEQESYEFAIDNFSGPLDLLLHLAKTHEIEISDISLDQLITEYLNYIDMVSSEGIDIASEYLEMAAELIRMKSQILLPNPDADAEDMFDELEELGLDRETLIERLLEYKKYKEVSEDLDDLSEKRHAYFTREQANLSKFRDDVFKNSLSMEDFELAIKKAIIHELDNKKEEKVIETHEIGMEQYLNEMEELTESFSFNKRISILSKPGIIALFLGVLEALKLQYISIEYRVDEIWVTDYKGDVNVND